MKRTAKQPNIFDFHNYRAFLKALFTYNKKSKSGILPAHIAKSLKIKQSYISDILAGRKALPKELLANITTLLKLNSNEVSFLNHLVELADSETLADRAKAFQKIIRFQNYRSRHAGDLVTHELLANWHYQVIRELTTLKDFKMDPRWIWRKLKYKVSISEIRQALRFLQNNQFIKVDKKGKVQIEDRLLKADGDVMKLALTHYNTEFLDLAAKALYVSPSTERHFLTYTVSITDDSYTKIRDKLESTLKEINEIIESDKKKQTPTQVYHIGLKAFPLTSSDKEDQNETDT